MPAFLPVLVAGSYLVLVADQVPKFDSDANCRRAAAASSVINRSEDICKKDENDARAKLEQQWGHFAPADRTRCVSMSRTGGLPSYVETLTCLEMAEAVNNLPEAAKLGGSKMK
jgi:hypothetical protein